MSDTSKQAVIYARVSSTKQVTEGSGLETQIYRCQEYCNANNLKVIQIFREEGVSGAVADRPALSELIEFVTKNPGLVIVIDDLKRLARDVSVYLTLKNTLIKLKAEVVYLNNKIEDNAEGRFIETLLSATSQLEREQNARQVKQKMKAKLEQGYWIFHCPTGFEKIKEDKAQILHPNKFAPIVRKALIKFATTEAGIATIKKDLLDAGIKKTFDDTKAMLGNPLYCGYLEYEPWNVSFRVSTHRPLIDLLTYNQIQSKLKKRFKPMQYLSDNETIFWLKSFLKCSECKSILRYSQNKNRHGTKYFYYFCRNPQKCSLHNKCYKPEQIDEQLMNYLKDIKFRPETIEIIKETIDQELENYKEVNLKNKEKLESELVQTKDKMKVFLDRIATAKDKNLVDIYEDNLNDLNKEKYLLEAKLLVLKSSETEAPTKASQTQFEKILKYITSPLSVYTTDDVNVKIMVLKMCFESPFYLSISEGVQTPKRQAIIELMTDFEKKLTFGGGRGI